MAQGMMKDRGLDHSYPEIEQSVGMREKCQEVKTGDVEVQPRLSKRTETNAALTTILRAG